MKWYVSHNQGLTGQPTLHLYPLAKSSTHIFGILIKRNTVTLGSYEMVEFRKDYEEVDYDYPRTLDSCLEELPENMYRTAFILLFGISSGA